MNKTAFTKISLCITNYKWKIILRKTAFQLKKGGGGLENCYVFLGGVRTFVTLCYVGEGVAKYAENRVT